MKVINVDSGNLFTNNCNNEKKLKETNPIRIMEKPVHNHTEVEKLISAYIGYNLVDRHKGYVKTGELELPFIDNLAHIYTIKNGDKYIILKKDGISSIATKIDLSSSTEDFAKVHALEHLILSNDSTKNYVKELNNLNIHFNADCSKSSLNFKFYGNIDKNDFINLIAIQNKLFNNKTFSVTDIEKEKNILLNENNLNHYDDIRENNFKNILKNMVTSPQNNIVNADNYVQNITKLTKKDIDDVCKKYLQNQPKTTVIVSPFSPEEIIKEIVKNTDLQKIKYPIKQESQINSFIKTKKEIGYTDLSNKKSNVSISMPIPNISNPKSFLIFEFLKTYIEQNKYNRADSNFYFNVLHNKINNNTNNPDILTISCTCLPADAKKTKEKIELLVSDLLDLNNLEQELNNFKLRQKDTLSKITENNKILADCILDEKSFNKERLLLCEKLTVDDIKNYVKQYFNVEKSLISVVNDTNKTPVTFKGMGNYKTMVFPNNLMLSLNDSPNAKRCAYGIELETNENFNKSPVLPLLLKNILIKKIENNGLNINAMVNLQSLGLDMNCISERAMEGLKALNNLLYADITPEEFEAAKKQAVINASIMIDAEVDCKYDELIYGDDPNYVSYSQQLKDLNEITYQDLQQFKNSFFNHSRASSSLYINKDDFEKNKNSIWHIIGNSSIKFVPYDHKKQDNKIQIHPLTNTLLYKEINDKTEFIQKTYKFPNSKNIDDFVAFYAIEKLLNSKISEKLRVEKNISYKSGCENISNLAYNNINALSVFAYINNNNKYDLKNTYSDIEKVIKDFCANPCTQKELDKLKNDLKLIYSDAVTSRNKMSLGLQSIQSQYKDEYLSELKKAIDNFDIKKLKNAANFLFSTKSLIQVASSKASYDELKTILKGEYNES